MSEVNNREVAIKLSGVKKMYKLGQIGGGTLTADIQSWWARRRGKEDPNTKIGTDQRLVGKTFMALNGIDLTVYKGEALGIIGGNGAGKSTMLKLLSRVTAPTEGEIDIYGRITSMLEVGTGFNGEMTGRENVYLNGAILGMTKAEIDAKMEDIIEFSEVREFIDTPVKRYSSGMYVKLAFSVAAHLDSEIMIMDEVLAVGDMAFQKKCLDKMRDAAKKEGRTVLYVSHNMNTIRQLCDRCVVLDKGKVVYEGNVEEGIGLYMGHHSVSREVIDLDILDRKYEVKGGARLISAKILNHQEWRIKAGEKVAFDIHIKSKNKLDNVCFRMRVATQNDESIGIIFARNLFSCYEDDMVCLSMCADVSFLSPGKYYFSPVVYGINSYGTFEVYDMIDRGIAFEVDSFLGFNENMPWLNRDWGAVKFPDMDVIGVTINEKEKHTDSK